MKNKVKLKTYIFISLIISIIFIVLNILINIYEYKIYRNNINNNLESIISLIETKYPLITKNEIMEILNSKLLKTEEKLEQTLRSLGSLKEDEKRAREQLDEIKHILNQAKTNMKSYKLPVTPKNFYVELGEAAEAINDMIKELDKRPISIKTLNTRVDTARDLTLKVYNTTKEAMKTARMAEAAIVYGNRYRAVYKDVELGLLKAENAFYKGNFKISLEQAINAINIVEPGIHKKLLEEYQ